MQTDPEHPSGCLLVLSTATCSTDSRTVQAFLSAERERNRTALFACVLRAIATGQLPRDADASALATMYDTFLVGLSIQARDGVPIAALDASISQMMRGWGEFIPATKRNCN